ncbi:MAG: RNA polymerase sigma factor [Comamonadaceae bacterium]
MPALLPAASTSPSSAALRDADIQAQLQVGDRAAAFTALLARYELKVFRLCVSLLHDTSLAQDMAQEVFLRVWRYLGHYDAASGAFSTWIYAIARNQCLSALARQPRPCDSLDDADIWQNVAQVSTATEVNDAASLALLRKLVQDLPIMQCSCLTLYYFEDNSVAEVAALLELPEGSVKTHLHRARQALRGALQERGLADAALWT